MESQNEFHVQQGNGRRIILFPFPLQGHINPMLQLASILYCKGFSISIIQTNFNSLKPSNYPHFNFHSFPDGLLKSEASASDLVALVSIFNVKCVEPFRDFLAKLLCGIVEEETIACLITDAAWHVTQAVAESFKIPRLILRTNSISYFSVYAALPLLWEKGYIATRDSEPETLLPEFPLLRVKDIPLFKTRCPETLHQDVLSLINQTKVSSGVIWNSFQDLEQVSLATLQKDFSIPMFPIGPFHKYFPASSCNLLLPDESSISWLDKQPPKSVVYVSFGSTVAFNESEIMEIAWGLANSKLPFLWVVRPGLFCGAEWIEPLPKEFLEMVDGRGHIVKWAPQQEVLAHPAVGGFWTHCGWNSTLESMCEAVPMICQPCFGDQMVNARYISQVWRVGLHLEKLERGEIERATRTVVKEAEGQEMRERMLCFKEKVDLSLKQGGSSCQSLESLINYILSF